MDISVRRIYHEKAISPFSPPVVDPFKPAVVLQKSQSFHSTPSQTTSKPIKPLPTTQPPTSTESAASTGLTSKNPEDTEIPKSTMTTTAATSHLDIINSTINSHGMTYTCMH